MWQTPELNTFENMNNFGNSPSISTKSDDVNSGVF